MNLPPTTESNNVSIKAGVEQDFYTQLLRDDDGAAWDLLDDQSIMNSQPSEFSVFAPQSGEAIDPALEQGCQAFYDTLDQVWNRETVCSPLGTVTLQDVWNKFGVNVPEGILREIVHQAQVTVKQSQEGMDTAIACVQALLPRWSIEDLQVFNRPLVYAMRSPQARVNITLPSLQNQEWEAISEFDQARIYLAIAHYVLNAETLPNP